MRFALVLSLVFTASGCASSAQMERDAWAAARARAAATGATIDDPYAVAVWDSVAEEDRTYGLGRIHGAEAAQLVNVGGRQDGGVVGGLTLGLIGTGIVYALAGSDDVSPTGAYVPAHVYQSGDEYSMGFREAYVDRVRERRRQAAVRGGLFGTGLAIIGWLVYLNSIE